MKRKTLCCVFRHFIATKVVFVWLQERYNECLCWNIWSNESGMSGEICITTRKFNRLNLELHVHFSSLKQENYNICKRLLWKLNSMNDFYVVFLFGCLCVCVALWNQKPNKNPRVCTPFWASYTNMHFVIFFVQFEKKNRKHKSVTKLLGHPL